MKEVKEAKRALLELIKQSAMFFKNFRRNVNVYKIFNCSLSFGQMQNCILNIKLI